MRGLAGVTVARDTILSHRNVHSGLMASSTAPNWRASPFLCIMLFFSPWLHYSLSLWITFLVSFEWNWHFVWPDWLDSLDSIVFLRAGGKDLFRHRCCWWTGNRFISQTFDTNIIFMCFSTTFLIVKLHNCSIWLVISSVSASLVFISWSLWSLMLSFMFQWVRCLRYNPAVAHLKFLVPLIYL